MNALFAGIGIVAVGGVVSPPGSADTVTEPNDAVTRSLVVVSVARYCKNRPFGLSIEEPSVATNGDRPEPSTDVRVSNDTPVSVGTSATDVSSAQSTLVPASNARGPNAHDAS